MMRKRIIAFAVCITILALTAGCQNGKTDSKTEDVSITDHTKATEQTTVEQTTVETTTVEPTTDSSRIANLRSGYWCNYNGGNSMTAYTFSDEVLENGQFVGHMLVYDVKDNTVSLMDVQDNNRMTNYEITNDAVLVTGEGGLIQTMRFAENDNVLIENSGDNEIRYVHFNSIPDYNALQKIAPTKKTTEPQTEVPKTKEDTLKEGMWISYSPQDVVFDAYVFSDDGILEKTGYSLVNGNVQEYKSVVFQTYRIRGNQILINDKSGKEWTWYFTDDEDTLEYAYQDGLGGETYTVSQKIRHYDSLPDYDTAMSERKNKN